MEAPAHIFVTGGTGFLGEYFLRLMAGRGHRIWALARPTAKRSHLDDLGLTWVEGDVTDRGSLQASVKDFVESARKEGRRTWLVHGAAVISYETRSTELHDSVNHEGTRNVVSAAQESGVDRLLHVSSVVAVGVAPDSATNLDEDALFSRSQEIMGRSYISDYMRTKRLAESEVLAAVEAGLDAVIVNPGAIFGEAQSPSNTAHVFERVDKSLIGRIAAPGSLSVVGAADVAKGMQLALERGRSGERYLLCDRNLELSELMRLIAVELGHDFAIRELSPALWRVLVAGASLLDKVKPLVVVTPTALELLSLHFRFDASKARRELGWQPQPFEQVLKETADWLRRIGLVG
jgi:dihydroflavonol-4-reductase